MNLISRRARHAVDEALRDTRVVLIQGPRQAGKSTLAHEVAQGRGMDEVTLDNLSVLSRAIDDPIGFVNPDQTVEATSVERSILIDEVQRAPELILAIKERVDRIQTPGQFLLTGSSRVFAMSAVADSLAGRVETINLWPLAQSEIANARSHFERTILGSNFDSLETPVTNMGDIANRMACGGFPESLARTEQRRSAFFESYMGNLINDQVLQIARIESPRYLRRLAEFTAAMPAQILNYSRLSQDLGIPLSTLKRYFSYLEMAFIVEVIPAWGPSRKSRLAKSPKVVMTDSGLGLHLAQETPDPSSPSFGHFLEAFVAGEIIKELSFIASPTQVSHFRSHDGHEVDLIISQGARKHIGIEIKATKTVRASDFKGLKVLADIAGDAFSHGIVLHGGKSVEQFGAKLWAVPITAVWS